jgi:hypothetical protein
VRLAACTLSHSSTAAAAAQLLLLLLLLLLLPQLLAVSTSKARLRLPKAATFDDYLAAGARFTFVCVPYVRVITK